MCFKRAKQGVKQTDNNKNINKGHDGLYVYNGNGGMRRDPGQKPSGMTQWNERRTTSVEDPGVRAAPASSGMTLCDGFTLIELLVVVLIIGILAAVALPQYQQAVLKSRYSTVMNNVNTIVNALEVYYLANGAYPTDDVTGLDIEISGCSMESAGTFICTNSVYDYFDGTNSNVGGFLTNKLGMAYVQYPIHNVIKPGVRECWADSNNPIANNVCKSLGGTRNGTSGWRSEAIYGHTTGGWNIYTLP